MESKDSFIFKRAGYRKSYAMQNKAGLHDFVLGGASVMQRRRFFYSVGTLEITLTVPLIDGNYIHYIYCSYYFFNINL